MTASLNPAAPDHLPIFITAPGETDVLMVVMAVVLVLAVLAVGLLFLRLHTLPERIAHKSHKLQFEIVAHRLATEYKVDALYDTANISTARWLTYPDENTRRNFEREQAASLATDVDENPVFLATNKYNLQVTMERWPKVGFHATREHGRRLAHA